MVEAVAEIKARYDVLVVGGGVAGISAAVAAARNGASVLQRLWHRPSGTV